jgi:hypothetical protein
MVTSTINAQAIQEIVTKGYTTQQADDAIPNGSRVKKVNSEPEDFHNDGEEGLVVGSIKHENITFYFVRWADFNKPVGVLSIKLEEISCS